MSAFFVGAENVRWRKDDQRRRIADKAIAVAAVRISQEIGGEIKNR